MSWVKEIKEFALKGNMVDLAIGVIIGTAFGKVVSSLVSDILMPPIGMLLGGVDFSALSLKLSLPGSTSAPIEVKYGLFINTLIDFLIIAVVIFLVMKGMNKLRIIPAKASLPVTKNCPECLMEVPIDAKKCGHCCSPLQQLHNHVEQNKA
jgi:large conductance mechanosensitive channel